MERDAKEQDVGEDAGEEGGQWQDQDGRQLPVDDWPPEENPALRMRWGVSGGCSEPRPLSTKLRVANEILTFLRDAAIENERIDKAMPATGIAQNLKKEKNVIVDQNMCDKVLGQATSQGLLALSSKTTAR